MQGPMMGHMMEHIRSGKMESVTMCPMMKEMAGETPKIMKQNENGHGSHH